MRAAVVALILITIAIMAAVAMHNEPDKSTVLVDAAFPLEQRIVIPWTLNTQCTVNSRNLLARQPERTA